MAKAVGLVQREADSRDDLVCLYPDIGLYVQYLAMNLFHINVYMFTIFYHLFYHPHLSFISDHISVLPSLPMVLHLF